MEAAIALKLCYYKVFTALHIINQILRQNNARMTSVSPQVLFPADWVGRRTACFQEPPSLRFEDPIAHKPGSTAVPDQTLPCRQSEWPPISPDEPVGLSLRSLAI